MLVTSVARLPIYGLGELIPGQGYQVRVKDGGAKSDFILITILIVKILNTEILNLLFLNGYRYAG